VGLPDRILICPGGLAVLIELKRPGKEPSKIQGHWLATFARMGFPAGKIDTLDGFRALLTSSTGSGKLQFVARGAPLRRS
jgi:hypothetical protein